MLNWIWAGLIVLSFVFAMSADLGDVWSDRFRNGAAIPVTLVPDDPSLDVAGLQEGEKISVAVSITAEQFASWYASGWETEQLPTEDIRLPATVAITADGVDLRVSADSSLPKPWAEMLAYHKMVLDAEQLQAERVLMADTSEPVATYAGLLSAPVALEFSAVKLRKIKQIEEAAFEFAKWSINFAIGLVGALCLWLGMMKIAEDAGLIFALVKVVRPLLGLIFPEVPKDHPAMGMIALNLSANVLGLGNAATPMGIKAMEELQKLNTTDDTATNSMCIFLAVNTASVQLVPPATLVAIMGVSTGQLWLPILIVTGVSLLIAISAAKALSLAPIYAKSDPMRKQPPSPATDEPTSQGGDR
ncbi:MAG: nucleoside recognition domain-containing protein [Planctomycetota bacterium]